MLVLILIRESRAREEDNSNKNQSATSDYNDAGISVCLGSESTRTLTESDDFAKLNIFKVSIEDGRARDSRYSKANELSRDNHPAFESAESLV